MEELIKSRSFNDTMQVGMICMAIALSFVALSLSVGHCAGKMDHRDFQERMLSDCRQQVQTGQEALTAREDK